MLLDTLDVAVRGVVVLLAVVAARSGEVDSAASDTVLDLKRALGGIIVTSRDVMVISRDVMVTSP